MTKKVMPREAHELVTKDGFVYLDVRTVAEFEAGHPVGAYNLPLLVDGAAGRAPNATFLGAAQSVFAADQKLVIGCLSGVRSARAAEALQAAGYTAVVVQAAGWGGLTDAFGRTTEPGWKASGLPSATSAEPGRSWAELSEKK